MSYSIGNGRVVIPCPWDSLDLWTVALSDDPPVFWFWKNTPTNHIWERIPDKDVPVLVSNFYNQAKDKK